MQIINGRLIRSGDWVCEITSARLLKLKPNGEYGDPYIAIANITMDNENCNVSGFLSVDGKPNAEDGRALKEIKSHFELLTHSSSKGKNLKSIKTVIT